MDIFKSILKLLFAIVPFLVSCSGGNNDDILGSTEYLNVTSVVSLPGDGSIEGTLEIKADCAWTITGVPSWLTLSEKSGSGNACINLTATPNPSSTDERSTALTVASTSGKIKRIVTVSQSIATELLTLSTNEISFISDGESKVLSINSNSAWLITGIEDWLSLSRQDGNGNTDITITAKKNDTEIQRRATLTVQCTNITARVVLTQDGHLTTLSVTPTVINANYIEDHYNLTLEGDASWSASLNVDWCSLNKLNGVGSDKLTLLVKSNTTQNEREGTITFTTSRGDKTCTVIQLGGTLPIISDFQIYDIYRYSFSISVTYSSEYEVEECGVCFSETVTTPTITDGNVYKAENQTNGNMTLTVDGLNSGRIYYVRAFVKNPIGITYSDVKTATTTGSIPSNDDNVKPQI